MKAMVIVTFWALTLHVYMYWWQFTKIMLFLNEFCT